MAITIRDFEQDKRGRRYQDVLERPIDRAALEAALAVMSRADALRRMQESEIIQDRPALAGLVLEIEGRPEFVKAFSTERPRETNRLKMAVGCAAKIVMERAHWKKTGRKGFLRAIAKRFISAERYVPSGPASPISLRLQAQAARYKKPETVRAGR